MIHHQVSLTYGPATDQGVIDLKPVGADKHPRRSGQVLMSADARSAAATNAEPLRT